MIAIVTIETRTPLLKTDARRRGRKRTSSHGANERRHGGATGSSRSERQSRWQRKDGTSVRGFNGRLDGPRRPVGSRGKRELRWQPEAGTSVPRLNRRLDGTRKRVRQPGQLNRRWSRDGTDPFAGRRRIDGGAYWPCGGPPCNMMETYERTTARRATVGHMARRVVSRGRPKIVTKRCTRGGLACGIGW